MRLRVFAAVIRKTGGKSEFFFFIHVTAFQHWSCAFGVPDWLYRVLDA